MSKSRRRRTLPAPLDQLLRFVWIRNLLSCSSTFRHFDFLSFLSFNQSRVFCQPIGQFSIERIAKSPRQVRKRPVSFVILHGDQALGRALHDVPILFLSGDAIEQARSPAVLAALNVRVKYPFRSPSIQTRFRCLKKGFFPGSLV